MNKIFFFIATLLLCSACTSRPEGFVIRGSFPGLQDGMMVSLRSMEGGAIFAVLNSIHGQYRSTFAVWKVERYWPWIRVKTAK